MLFLLQSFPREQRIAKIIREKAFLYESSHGYLYNKEFEDVSCFLKLCLQILSILWSQIGFSLAFTLLSSGCQVVHNYIKCVLFAND